jgi:hypothetical protein
MVKKVFLKAPAYHGGRTAGIDKNIRMLADDAGVTDLNNRGGQAAFQYDRGMDRAADSMRAQMMSGQTYAAGMSSGDNAIQGTLAEGGFKGDNALSQVKDMLTPPKPNVQGSWNGKA